MTRSENGILTTHAGSLIRPREIIEIMRDIELGEGHDELRLRQILPGAVARVVDQQAGTGIDIPSDGEYGKHGWIRYVRERLGGLEAVDDDDLAGKLWSREGLAQKRFAGFYSRYAQIERTAWLPDGIEPVGRGLKAWACTGPVSYIGHEALARDIANMKAALDGHDFADAFMPVVAPASAELHLVEHRHYETDEEFLFAIADALGEEYKTIVDAGFIVQIDDAMLPMRALAFDDYDDYRAWAQLRIDALNHALKGIPEDRVRYHICWGSQNVPHTWDIPLSQLVDLVLQVNAQAYSLEAGNPRHEHEWQVWKDVALPEGKTLIPGVISHSTNVVEHPELVAMRLCNFASAVGKENIIAGTDCGFSQNWDLLRMHPEVQWAKLEALVEGAALARKQLWN
jgi:5-methyltetrahydropteroyltriglutamate--homocysteine methyltransferase